MGRLEFELSRLSPASGMSRIHIYDSTLRDGAQAQGISYSVEDKIKIVHRLDELGIRFPRWNNRANCRDNRSCW